MYPDSQDQEITHDKPFFLAINCSCAVMIVSLGSLAGSETAWAEKVLFRFTAGNTSGYPNSGLIADKLGNLYGTTNLANGAVFELPPPSQPGGSWTQTVLYFFQGGSDGFSPSGSRLAMDAQGNLYGSNSLGGVINSKCTQG